MLFRIIILAAVIALAVYVYRRFFKSMPKPKKNPCPRCGGQGYLEELRGRTKCPMCKGSGTDPDFE